MKTVCAQLPAKDKPLFVSTFCYSTKVTRIVFFVISAGLLLTGGLAWLLWPSTPQPLSHSISLLVTSPPVISRMATPTLVEATPVTNNTVANDPLTNGQILHAQDIPGVDPAFTFSATLPPNWQAEAVPASQAITIFDPSLGDKNNLEKSQIFIRYFKANEFLTLSNVTILERTPVAINGQAAVRYRIEKKPNTATFNHQPSWRNQQHTVTDIRVSDDNPAIFYVIAQRPDLPDETYQVFLNSLQVKK